MDEVVRTLSQRQWEFLKLVALGATDKQIAHSMFISPHTVRNYFTMLFEYTGFHPACHLGEAVYIDAGYRADKFRKVNFGDCVRLDEGRSCYKKWDVPAANSG